MTEYLQQSHLDEMQKQCIETIDRSSHLLLDILSDILEMSKLNKGQVPLAAKPTSLSKIFDDMEKVLHPSIQNKSQQLSIKFEIDESLPEEFWIDPKRLKKLLLYLIGNAIKFSDTGVIQVKANLLQPTEPEYLLFISIEDQGIGIPPEQLNRLFDAFTQVDESTTRHHGGIGLGLALCKATIRLMKGQLGVESKEGVGSTFWFKVPIQLMR
jgi:signal transduction histidine kinase